MTFTPIDLAHWDRKEYFDLYYTKSPCTYSMTVDLDITHLRSLSVKLYPAMLYLITKTVNEYPQFRTVRIKSGSIGVFSQMYPYYTVFQKESETFSNLWTAYHPDYHIFSNRYETDMKLYGHISQMVPKPNVPENVFPVSMIPWSSFRGFNLNLKNGYTFLQPTFTMGRFFHQDNRCLLPISVQVHHAVCDGFHLSRFLNQLQQEIADFCC